MYFETPKISMLLATPAIAAPRSVAMPKHRDHVVRRDDAGQAAVLVDHGERDEVVLVEERRDFVLRRIRRAEHRVLAQLRELSRGRRRRDLDERDRADER